MLYYDILDKKRKEVLKRFKSFKDDFYLAGGTALALQIRHRDSIDFDFFDEKDINTKELFDSLTEIFSDYNIQKVQEESNTLSVVLDDDVFLSFMSYKYPLIGELKEDENIKLASLPDIAAMKLSAIVSRATEKDYIDIYFLLKQFSLKELLDFADKKFSGKIDKNLIMKSLVYFDDIEVGSVKMIREKSLNFEDVKRFLQEEIKNFAS